MPGWQGSDRRDRLPPDWEKRRKRVLKRDNHECQVRMDNGTVCGDLATEVDHKRAGDNHEDWNLQAICSWHHKRKSSGEGGSALAAKRKQIDQRFRRTEDHPGLL